MQNKSPNTRSKRNRGFKKAPAPVKRQIRKADQEVWTYYDKCADILISSHGRVWETKRDKFKKLMHMEYFRFQVMREGKTVGDSVHRAVARAFVPGWFEGAIVNHLNGDKYDNWWQNLEWTTQSQNIAHAFSSGLLISKRKITKKKLREALRQVETTTRPIKEIAAEYGISGHHLGKVAKGQVLGRVADKSHRPRYGKGKMTRADIANAVVLLKAGELTQAEIGKLCGGVSSQVISQIAHGKISSSVTGITRDNPLPKQVSGDKWTTKRGKKLEAPASVPAVLKLHRRGLGRADICKKLSISDKAYRRAMDEIVEKGQAIDIKGVGWHEKRGIVAVDMATVRRLKKIGKTQKEICEILHVTGYRIREAMKA